MSIDNEILLKLAEGDHQAFKFIFRSYYSKIRAFSYGFLKDMDDADELAQLIFVKLWDKRMMLQNVRNFDSYLFMLAKHTVLNFIEARHMLPIADEEMPVQPDNKTPFDDLIAHDLQLLVDLVVSNMPFQRRQIYRMSRELGMPNDEIAEKLGIQKKTVENHLNLALKELKNIIDVFIILYIMLIN